MDPKIIEFLDKHRVSCLTTLLKDGSPHGAALHYSHKSGPFEVFFSTDDVSVKCEALLEGGSTKASVVIGFSEEEWITLQMDGTIEIIRVAEEVKMAQEVHYAKHPHSAKFKDDPKTVFLKFTPRWWRLTDYNTDPYTIVGSQK